MMMGHFSDEEHRHRFPLFPHKKKKKKHPFSIKIKRKKTITEDDPAKGEKVWDIREKDDKWRLISLMGFSIFGYCCSFLVHSHTHHYPCGVTCFGRENRSGVPKGKGFLVADKSTNPLSYTDGHNAETQKHTSVWLLLLWMRAQSPVISRYPFRAVQRVFR